MFLQKMARYKIQIINTGSDLYLWGANFVLDIFKVANKITIILDYHISRILSKSKI